MSLNKIKTQKTHQERHQPAGRSHLGPLEKKKDYVKRAKAEGQKRDILKSLNKKALNKNPDEFSFHMYNSQVKEGLHYEKVDDKKLSMKNVNQDLVYITNQRTIEKKKINRLMSVLHLIDTDVPGAGNGPKHTIFVDTEEEANGDIATILDTHPDLVNSQIRLKRSQLATMNSKHCNTDMANLKEMSKSQKKMYKELHMRIEREKKLSIIQEKLSVRKNLMNTSHGFDNTFARINKPDSENGNY